MPITKTRKNESTKEKLLFVLSLFRVFVILFFRERQMTEPSDLVENPALPRLMPLEDGFAPQAPTTLAETGIDPAVLADLALKAAYTVPNFITEWAARRLHLPLQLAQQLFEQLRQ